MSSTKADSLRIEDMQSLKAGCIKETPQFNDWSSMEYEDYTVIQPYDPSDPEFKTILVEEYGYSEDADPEDVYWEIEDGNHPIYNYYYPLVQGISFDQEDAKKIRHLNTCLVYLEDKDQYVLSLTGCGMDMSWDIVESYIRLGYYPPVHFRLPNFAGTPNNLHNRVIINSCIESRKIVKGWMDSDIRDFEHLTRSIIDSNPVPE